MLNTPDIKTDTTPGYASLIASNFDTVQESFKVRIPETLAARLEAGKQKALEKHEGQGTYFDFAGQEFQIWGGASQGNKWVLECDDFQIHFGPPSRDWPVTVRYLSAGLWEHGFQAVKDRVVNLLETECVPLADDLEDWCHLSRADYAFDFYSPEFTKEMNAKRVAKNILATSGVKIGEIGPSSHTETIYIGMNRKSLQICIYDKGQEITEISGKSWMFKVWEREGYYPSEDKKAKDVWRVEIRFGKEFLKDRNIRTFEKFHEALENLIAESIMRRRLIVPGTDSNKARCDLHPIFSEVFAASGGATDYVPVGRQITLKRMEYKEMLMKQKAGLDRAISVLHLGHWSENYISKINYDGVKMAMDDPKHAEKIARCVEKQRFIDEAR